MTCGLVRGSPPMSQSNGRAGCQSWEREPGIDDDDWDPPGSPRIGRYVLEPPPTPHARRPSVDGWWTEACRPVRATPPPAPAPACVLIALQTRDSFDGYFVQEDD